MKPATKPDPVAELRDYLAADRASGDRLRRYERSVAVLVAVGQGRSETARALAAAANLLRREGGAA